MKRVARLTPLERRPWGMEEFHINDPHGNLLSVWAHTRQLIDQPRRMKAPTATANQPNIMATPPVGAAIGNKPEPA